jgi:hypothetical protein
MPVDGWSGRGTDWIGRIRRQRRGSSRCGSAGATITVRAGSTGLTRVVVTDQDGRYRGRRAAAARAESILWYDSSFVVARRCHDHAGSAAQALSGYTTVSLYRNNVGTTIYHGFYVKLEQRFTRGLSYLVSYTRSKLVDDASSVFDASILTGLVTSSGIIRVATSPTYS